MSLDALRDDIYRAFTTPRHVPVEPTKGSGRRRRDKDEAAGSLLVDLLVTGITLLASYLAGKVMTNLIQSIQGTAGQGEDATDSFIADNGTATGKGGGVINRLRRLLAARHEATLRAMMEELEDHQLEWKRLEEEKKEGEDDNDEIDDEEEHMERRMRTERQYSQLQDELHIQHQESLSKLSQLSPYEMNIAQGNVIDPSALTATFADVGGMDDIKSEIYDLVVLPLLRPDLFVSDSGLVSPPKGILLYGPPGTGKTMIAKAIAKESHATFVNVQLSTIMNKWFGESNKMISATFQLARKLAPSVVFIDEIDAFLSQRDGTEGSAVSSMKSEFLTLWDGLLSERKGRSPAYNADNAWRISLGGRDDDEVAALDDEPPLLAMPPIIVLGATNRPYDVDPAILRRLPRSFEVPLPNLRSRLQLLRLFLQKQTMTPSARAFLPQLAELTEGYSGSDLKEVCRAAAWEPVREMTSGASRRLVGIGASGGNEPTPSLRRASSGFPPRGTKARAVDENDFLLAIRKVKRTGESARQFHKKEVLRGREERAALAAQISREESEARRRAGAKRNNGNNKNRQGPGNEIPRNILSGNEQLANVDVQQIMAMAMAAASSMNLPDERTGDSSSVEEEDSDAVPNMS